MEIPKASEADEPLSVVKPCTPQAVPVRGEEAEALLDKRGSPLAVYYLVVPKEMRTSCELQRGCSSSTSAAASGRRRNLAVSISLGLTSYSIESSWVKPPRCTN
jgi:hypothetical protein